MLAFLSIIAIFDYIVKGQVIATTADDILCATGSEHDLVDGRYKYFSYNSEFKGTVYYDANTTQYLYPFVDTGFYGYLIHTEPTDDWAHSFCLVNTALDSNYVFNIDDCYANWLWATGDDTTPWKDDVNLRVINCNNICITNNDKDWLNGVYIWSHINLTTNSSVYYCTECRFGVGAYLYGWIVPSAPAESGDLYLWAIGPSYKTGNAWSLCLLGPDLGPNYVFKLENCVGWGTYNGSAWNIDADLQTNKCVLPTTTTNKPLTTSTTLTPTTTTNIPTTRVQTTSIQTTTTNITPSPTTINQCGTNRWCFDIAVTPNIHYDTEWNVLIQNEYVSGTRYFDIDFIVSDTVSCINPRLTFVYERIDYDSSNEYIDVFNNNGVKIEQCGAGDLSNLCNNFATCFSQRSLGINRINVGDTYRISLTESSGVNSLCSHSLSINATATLYCQAETTTSIPVSTDISTTITSDVVQSTTTESTVPESTLESTTSIQTTSDVLQSTISTATTMPIGTKVECGTNRWCFNIAVSPNIQYDTEWNVLIQNEYVSGIRYFDIDFIVSDTVSCINPRLTFIYERIDYDSSHEYIDVFDNNNALIARCGAGVSNSCNNFATCLSQRSVGINQINAGNTYQISLTESSGVNDLCSNSLSINANVTLYCQGETSIPISTNIPTLTTTISDLTQSPTPTHDVTTISTSNPLSTILSTPAPIQILNITSGLRVKHESCHMISSIYYMNSSKWSDRGFCDDKYDCNEIDDSKYEIVDEYNPLIIDTYSMPSININVEGIMDDPNIKCLKYNESKIIISNKMYQFKYDCGCKTVDDSYIICYDCARYFCSDNQPLICYHTTDTTTTQKPLLPTSRPITDNDCSYIDFSGPIPADICYYKYKSNAYERSSMFECNDDGHIILNEYLNNDCSGNPEVSEDYSFKGYNYYCLNKICDDTIRVIRDCMNNGEYSEILRVNNICLNNSKTVCAHNNIFTFTFDNEQCDGFPISSINWEQSQESEDDTICQITSQCMASMETESDNDKEKEWETSDTIIIVIVVIVVIMLIVAIIFIVYYYKIKKRTDTGSKQKQKENNVVNNNKSNTNKITYDPIPNETETVTEAEMTDIETFIQNEKQ